MAFGRNIVSTNYGRNRTRATIGSWCVKGTEESTLEVDSSVPFTHHDPRDLGLICLVKKRKIRFQILSDLRIQSWIFLNKRTLRFHTPREETTKHPDRQTDAI